MKTTSRVGLGVSIVVALGALAGCGSDDPEPNATDDPSATAATTDASTRATPSDPTTTATPGDITGRRLRVQDLPLGAKGWKQGEAPTDFKTRCGPDPAGATDGWSFESGSYIGRAFYGSIVYDYVVEFDSERAARAKYEELRKRAQSCKAVDSGTKNAPFWDIPTYRPAATQGFVLTYAESGRRDGLGAIIRHGVVVNLTGSDVRWAYYTEAEYTRLTVDDFVPLAEAHEDG